ncbi:MAG TPA: T9SS type A sorting domain-containing protein, partial [Hymenobacter sp.]|uniref:T9SS type A sorting domain-containing protein n=1 Tax=Hymenobacter sp. TaxID=1898978 RepID=UPI002ED89CC5
GLSGNIRRFSLNNIGRNLLASVVSPAGAAPGAQYRFDVRFTAIDNVNGTRLETTFRRSVFRVIGARPAPTNISSTQILVDSDGVDPKTTNVTYDASAATSAPDFQGFNFGAFDINTGQLFLNGGRVTTFESNGDQVSAVRLFYRIYKSGALTAGGFTNIALQGGGTATNGTRTFDLTTAQQNLITGLANQGIGSFFIETYFEADVARPNGTFAILRDDNNTNFYRATLSTTGIPIVTITWTGGIDDDWFTPGNWDLNRVPDANTNVIIPDFGPSVSTPYPNINSDVSYTTSRNTVKNNIGSGPALARNLALQGGSQALRSILRVIVGRLKVTGDFSNQFDSFIMRDGTTLELAGVNQEISGGSGFANVVISGGGIKNLPGSMLITESFTFDNANGGGIFTTDIAQPTRSFVELSDRASNNNNNGAQLVGETETSYIRGFVKTNRANVTANEAAPRTFGGIGLELLFTGANNPGDVLVTRNTAENYTPLGSKFSIRRIFGVRPSSPNTNSGGLTATMRFRYLDNETVNLGPGGTGVIPEPNLTIFVSTNSGGTFGLVGRDGPVDQTNNIVTRTGVRTFATFTLGDTENPLPVRLTAFDAQRLGANALITWKTATELNSKGYEVQVSTNGKDFRSLAEVASASPNSTRETEYRYIDVEKNKSGIRYYRLRQIDLDGKETFFAARSVSFEGKASEATTLAAYPNPFRNGDQVHLALQSSQGGKGQLRITDLSGRMIREEAVTLTTGLSDFAVPGMSELKAGLYMVNLTLPSGEVKKLKVAKQ